MQSDWGQLAPPPHSAAAINGQEMVLRGQVAMCRRSGQKTHSNYYCDRTTPRNVYSVQITYESIRVWSILTSES